MDNSKYEAVRAKIKEACPDAVEVVEWQDNKPSIVKDSPLRISHVLRAIAKTNKAVTVNVFGYMQVASPSVSSDGLTIEWEGCDYDLEKDDLSLQSPETIQFLFNILCE